MLRCIIVDDEKVCRDDLRQRIEPFSDISIEGEASTLEEGRDLIHKLGDKLDLVFLDIQVHSDNGFQLVPIIPPKVRIIFVTAFEQFAIRAFEVNALDYILKPINEARFNATLEKALKPEKREETQSSLLADDQVFLESDGRRAFIPIATIELIEADGDYAHVFTDIDERFYVRRTIASWENQLPTQTFVRIHRSMIINTAHIKAVKKLFGGMMEIEMGPSERTVKASRRYAQRLKRLLNETGH